MSTDKKDWFKIKRYPHIGLPLNAMDRYKWIEPYVKNPDVVAKHSFLPFIHKTSKVKKFRKVYLEHCGQRDPEFIDGKKVLRKSSEKKRELFYASHLDSLIYSYYSQLLAEAYESKLTHPSYDLHEVVNAYRRIPINPAIVNGSNKCNIDFANDVFKHILKFEHDDFYVIAFDITSFFDNLDHAELRKMWAEVLEVERLPPDHFNVFKNITRFSYIDIVDIFTEFQSKIYTRKINKFGKPLKIVQKNIAKIKHLRNQNAIAFCTKDEFINAKQKLLQPSKTKRLKNGKIILRNFGIPQGSPISSVLANIYLLKFDQIIQRYVSENKGIYKRYSDDIVVVIPAESKIKLIDLVYQEIHNQKLEIQPSKTQIFNFQRINKQLKCGQEFAAGINWNKNFVYLGFEFDGKFTLLKSASVSGFYRKMKRYVRRAKHHASKPYNQDKGLFKRRIYKRFSYKGAKRIRRIFWNDSEKKFEKTEVYNYGNFLTYAFKASKKMVNSKIEKQMKRHWNILNNLLK